MFRGITNTSAAIWDSPWCKVHAKKSMLKNSSAQDHCEILEMDLIHSTYLMMNSMSVDYESCLIFVIPSSRLRKVLNVCFFIAFSTPFDILIIFLLVRDINNGCSLTQPCTQACRCFMVLSWYLGLPIRYLEFKQTLSCFHRIALCNYPLVQASFFCKTQRA